MSLIAQAKSNDGGSFIKLRAPDHCQIIGKIGATDPLRGWKHMHTTCHNPFKNQGCVPSFWYVLSMSFTLLMFLQQPPVKKEIIVISYDMFLSLLII